PPRPGAAGTTATSAGPRPCKGRDDHPEPVAAGCRVRVFAFLKSRGSVSGAAHAVDEGREDWVARGAAAEVWALGVEPFGVPLDPVEAAGLVDHRLDDAVGGPGAGAQARGQGAQALVMDRVDQELPVRVERGQPRLAAQADRVLVVVVAGRVAVDQGAGDLVADVLIEVAAERGVHQLDPAADPEHWFALGHRRLEQHALVGVAGRVAGPLGT